MHARLNNTVHLLRHFGPGWLMFRMGYAFRRRAGVLRRTLPATTWDRQPLASFLRDRTLADVERYAAARCTSTAEFFFAADDAASFRPHFQRWDANGDGPIAVADAMEQGIFRFFEHHDINLGCPPDWHHNPITGDRFPRDRHWTQIGDFAAGDIKFVWEPNRFAWVYALVRAYWRTGDERYPRLFWRLFEDWRAANPPQQGVNWKCGQEVALRVMACCFGLHGLATSLESTPERVSRLAQLMAVSARRIERNLSYALSQQNNHGISEAVGLWTVGLLFPEFRSSSRWLRMGREAIERQTRDLIDADGAFSQHSVNYQRVMLDACLWAIRLGERNGQPLSTECVEQVVRAGEFLWQLQDDLTGELPRYGPNDGALVLPLSNCAHADYRPVVQSVSLLSHKRRFEPGPWDESALWLFGPEALNAPGDPADRADWHGATGGYQVLRAEAGHLVTRAPCYRHRPADADALHADVWWRGINVAMDAGTHSYNAAPPWDNSLSRTACHNTVTVDGHDQMDRAGRFLWLPWLSGERTAYAVSPGRQLTYWEGTHDGYGRLPEPVRHRRGIVRIGSEHWLVIDSLVSRHAHAYRLHWLLPDLPFITDEGQGAVTLSTIAGDYRVIVGCSPADGEVSLVRADDASPRGWHAPHYTDRQPALSLALEASGTSVMFVTLLGPQAGVLRIDARSVEAHFDDQTCRAALATPTDEHIPLPATVELIGATSDTLALGADQYNR